MKLKRGRSGTMPVVTDYDYYEYYYHHHHHHYYYYYMAGACSQYNARSDWLSARAFSIIIP